MKTRIKKASTAKTASRDTDTTAKAAVRTLEAPDSNPPQVFILPNHLSPDSRIVTLPNPATLAPNRYLICARKGCFEFTRVSAPKRECRSLLLAPDSTTQSDAERSKDGYVLQTPDLMLATPVDPLFLAIPALVQDAQHGGKPFYLPLSDYSRRLGASSPHLQEVFRSGDSNGSLNAMFEDRMKAVCDRMHDGVEDLYMLSKSKLISVLMGKAKKMTENGLPASMEEEFVKQALIAPMLSVRREKSEVSLAEQSSRDTEEDAGNDAIASEQTSQDSQVSSTSVDSVSTAATSVSATSSPSDSSGDIRSLLRLRTAFNFMLHSYVPESLRNELSSLLGGSVTLVDFTPLDKHLVYLDKLRKEAQALRSLSDNISRKRSADEDEEASEKAEAKKRKKAEEELKKKNTSRGVKQLEKVDRSGMKTLSSFFGKVAAKK